MNQAKADCEALMSAALPFAERMLNLHGEFFPYAAAMRPTGEIVSIAGYDGQEHPPSADVIHFLKDILIASARSKEYKATAIVYDVKVTLPSSGEKSDAVAVVLDHRDNYSVVVLRPYTLANGKVTVGAAFAQRGAADIFSPK